MRLPPPALFPVLVLACLTAFPVRAADPIGLVKNVSGTVTVQRGATAEKLVAGAPLYAADALVTGDDASLGLTLRDDTTLSMGPKSRLVLESFAFDPAADAMKMGLEMKRGTFAVTSGQIAKLAPEAVSVRTPVMNIGIRGTRFLVEVAGDE